MTLPPGWAAAAPRERDVAELTELLRRHERRARGWAGATEDDVLVELSEGARRTRENTVVRDADGVLRGWAGTHDRAAGRMLLRVLADWELHEPVGGAAADALCGWADQVAGRGGGGRGARPPRGGGGAVARG